MNDKTPPELTHEDFRNALRDMDSYIDVTLEDLMLINKMAAKHARLRQAETLLVRDIMTTDVATVSPTTPLRDAARMLLELRISGLPVTNAQGTLLGIITEADFLSALGIPAHHPAHNLWQTLESMFRHQPSTATTPANVADILTHNIVTIRAENTLHEAIDLMKEHHVKRLVVVDDENRVLGIITRSNLVRVLLKKIL